MTCSVFCYMSAAASLHAPRLRILYLHSTHAHSVVHALHASMLAAHHTLAPAMRCSMQIALFIKITMHGFNPFEQPIYFFVKWQPCSSTQIQGRLAPTEEPWRCPSWSMQGRHGGNTLLDRGRQSHSHYILLCPAHAALHLNSIHLSIDSCP